MKFILDRKDDKSQAEIVRQHFNNFEREINTLRQQQKAIFTLLQERASPAGKSVSKDQWMEIMKTFGFDSGEIKLIRRC